MCYEFESWHWKARAKEMHKAQVRTDAAEQRTEQRSARAEPAKETQRARPEVKEPEKIPV